ncbi:MAG: cytochrome c [Hyphomonadaceae bacterium]|nr:cytochrome c [Hyphomonadaceae bacterium]
MSQRRLIMIAAAAAATLAFSQIACAEEAAAPAAADSAALYERQCGICHDAGGFGTVMLERRVGAERSVLAQRNDLPPAYVRHVVRNGLRDMPPLTRVELPDADLEAIAQYLQRARQ